MTIKNFLIEYDAINRRNTFTNGDVINGRIIVETSKETKIQALVFIAKAKARVCWRERRHHHHHHNHHHSDYRTYRAQETYYEVKQHILREDRQDGTEVIGEGRHVFPFSFKIPDRNLPSSFQDLTGKIGHKVKAELKQSMKFTKKAQAYYTFVPKLDMAIPGLMDPQYACKDKSIKTFGSGNVSLDAHTLKMGYQPGEAIQVTAEIMNNSSRSAKPKFTLYEEMSYFAQGHSRHVPREILREKAESLEPSSGKKTITKVITIPKELPPSILNCSIIKLEYTLKIHLDIKYALDPEIKLPVVILPKVSGAKQPPAAAYYGFEGFGSPNHPTWSATPQQAAPRAMDPPPQYGVYPTYPPLSSDMF